MTQVRVKIRGGGKAAALGKEGAAVKIQSAYRGHRARASVKSLREVLEEQGDAAVKIQAGFRGHRARKQLQKPPQRQRRHKRGGPKAADERRARAEREAAATKIQAGFRGHRARRQVAEVRREREAAATKIQAGFRGHRVRRRAAAARPKGAAEGASGELAEVRREQEAAATKIQAGFRGHRVRQQAAGARREREAAATKIQAGFRGHQARRRVDSVKRTVGRPRTPVAPEQAPTAAEAGEPGPLTVSISSRAEVEGLFALGKKLGEGNFAEVRYCERRDSGAPFALKIIDKAKMTGAKEAKMIENEIKTMRRIDHENCVRLFDAYETVDNIFLVMEYMAEGDLFDRIVRKGPFKESGAVVLMKCMASAIFYMHSQKLIHRDLKPENLLMYTGASGAECIKLADFGLSLTLTEPLHNVCGTPTYVAPEVIDPAKPGYGLPVDMWALGVILYIVFCGFPPFASAKKNQRELFKKIQSGRFKFPAPYWTNISIEAKHLIKGLLRVDQNARYTARDLVKHPWLHGRKMARRPRALPSQQPPASSLGPEGSSAVEPSSAASPAPATRNLGPADISESSIEESKEREASATSAAAPTRYMSFSAVSPDTLAAAAP